MSESSAAPDHPPDPIQVPRSGRRWAAAVCLAVPVVALLGVPWYAGTDVHLAGVRLFYWYQFAWVPGSVVFMVAAYLLRGGRDRE
ncbi:DUF3311 domain-containing protein [Actinomadura syzygii]|uniref:DUF3311 domain-containing protein n=1 Tax=Actinomadura syzygii TaxID=1427538 RepID=A0A5D0UC21_9ACTN|nr:DUF3311 domain-containing protein [Actinomadura syzygii]TYC16081.1 DUF3311 domain-containing protein [Actinomadura syzygii]